MKALFKCNAANVRLLVRAWNKFLQLYSEVFELRLQKTKTGMRLRYDAHYVDVNVDASGGKIAFDLSFSPGCPNNVVGLAATLVGAYIHIVEALPVYDGKTVFLDVSASELTDLKTVRKWGRWALDKVNTKFPGQINA